MSDYNEFKEIQNKKQSEQQFLEQTEIKSRTITERDNPAFFESKNKNTQKSSEDIFRVEEYRHGMFGKFAENDAEVRKNRQKNLVKDLAHEEESGKFSLMDSLDYSPQKILEWLKAQAAVNDASKSFLAIITAMETMINCEDEARQTASYNLKNQVEAYLAGHKKRPVTLQGRQRVTACKGILENIDSMAFTINWKKEYADGSGEKIAQTKKSFEEYSKDHQKTAERLEISDIDMSQTEKQRLFNNMFKREGFPEEQKEKARENIEWNNAYASTALFLHDAKSSGASDKDIEGIREQRKPLLDSLIKELDGLSEDYADKIMLNPRFFQQNYTNLIRLMQISDWAKNAMDNADAIDKFFFEEMEPAKKQEIFDKSKLVSELINFGARMTEISSEKRDEHWANKMNASRANDTFVKAKNAKDEAFKSEYLRESAFAEKEKWRPEFIKHYSYLTEKGMNSKRVIRDAKACHKKVDDILKKFSENSGGEFGMPGLKEAKRIQKSGTLEEKYAFLLSYGNLNGLRQIKISPEYNQVFFDMIKAFDNVYENKKSDSKGVSKKDYLDFSFLMWSHSFVEKQKYGENIDKKLKALPKDASEEQKLAAKRDVEIEAMSTHHGHIWEAPTGGIIISINSNISEQFLEMPKLIGTIPGMEEEVKKTEVTYEQFQKDKRKYKTDKVYKDAHDKRLKSILDEGVKNGSFVMPENYQKPLTKEEKYSVLYKEMEKDKKAKKSTPIKPLKKKKNTKEDNAARAKLEGKVKYLSPLYDLRGEKLAEYMIKSSEFKLKQYQTVNKEATDFGRVSGDYFFNFLHYVNVDIAASGEDLKRKNEWNARFMDLFKKTIISRLKNEDIKAEAINAASKEISKKNAEYHKQDKNITQEERDRIKEKYLKEYEPRYIPISEEDKEAMADMLIERAGEILDYEITLSNIKDVNWVEEHAGELSHLSTLAGLWENIVTEAEGSVGGYTKEKIKALPEYEVITKKLNMIAMFGSAISEIKNIHGINLEGKAYKIEELMQKQGTAGDIQVEIENNSGPILRYQQIMQGIVNSWEEYNTAREKFLSGNNN